MEGSLTGRVARGISWTGATQAVDAVATAASLFLLARLLSPADFGAQAVAGTVAGIALMVGDLGLGSALVQTPVLRRADVRRAILLCLLSGAALGGVTLGGAGWVGRVYGGTSGVRELLCVLWVCAVLHPAGAVPRALLTRRMDFRRLAVMDAAAAVAGAVTAVALAARGAGALSLAWGYVARVGLSSVLSWFAVRGSWSGPHPGSLGSPPLSHTWERGSRAERGGVRATRVTGHKSPGEGTNGQGVLRFGLQATGAGVLNYLSASVDYLLIGRYLGPTALGLYYLAYQLVSMVHFRAVSVLLRVLHPALASVQGDLERLRRGYLRSVRGIALIVFPVLALLCALAGQVVPMVYGPEKEGAIRLVEILCAMGIAKAIGGAVGPVFLARGRADVALLWNLFALATVTVAVSGGIAFGVTGAAVAVSLNALLLLIVSEGIVHRLVPMGFRDYFGALAPAFWCAALAGGAVKGGVMLASAHFPPAVTLACGAAFGATIYGGLICAFHRSAVSEAVEFVRAWRGRGRKCVSGEG